jgi:hypothetical protein
MGSANAPTIFGDKNQILSDMESSLDWAEQESLWLLEFLTLARKSARCATAEEIYQSRCGTLVSACLRSLATAMKLLTSGPLATPITHKTKLMRDLPEHSSFRERLHANDSMASTPSHAKPANTGKKLKARSRLATKRKSRPQPKSP